MQTNYFIMDYGRDGEGTLSKEMTSWLLRCISSIVNVLALMKESMMKESLNILAVELV
jgi:hypothetical protein